MAKPFTRSKGSAATYEAGVGAWLTDVHREITAWTDEAARLMGYSAERHGDVPAEEAVGFGRRLPGRLRREERGLLKRLQASHN